VVSSRKESYHTEHKHVDLMTLTFGKRVTERREIVKDDSQ